MLYHNKTPKLLVMLKLAVTARKAVEIVQVALVETVAVEAVLPVQVVVVIVLKT